MSESATTLDLPSVIPVFPLTGVILLPGANLPLNIFEPRYLAMTRDAIAGPHLIGMIQPLDPADKAFEPALYNIGCVGRLTDNRDTPDGRIMITLVGTVRFEIERELTERTTPYRQMVVRYDRFVGDLHPENDEPMDRDALLAVLRRFLEVQGVNADWNSLTGMRPDALVNALAMSVPFAPGEKQALLEAKDIAERARILITLLEMATVSGGDAGDKPVQ
jgi:hypothetical protein